MDRRKKLATAGAVSLTATAAVVALGASVGLFGLTDNSPRVGKLSPIDSTHVTSSSTPDTVQTIIVDDPAPAANGGAAGDDRPGTTSNTTPSATPHSDDRPQTTVSSAPPGDDHGTDGADDASHSDDNRGPGSTSSGRDHDEDD